MAEEQTLLVPLDDYLKMGLHIGTKFRTTYMSPFIYKVRPDGLAVMNVQEIDRRIGIAAKVLSRYTPQDIIVVCRRENGWKAAKMFSKATGIRCITGRYPPGILTNPSLKKFTEASILFAVDPWPDKNAINDGIKIGLPIIALCDTNNEATDVDFLIPCNNKGKKALGLIFYILAREYLKNRGAVQSVSELKLGDFSDED